MPTKQVKPNQPSTKTKKPRQKAIKLSDIQAKQKDINKLTTYVYDEEKNIVIRYNEKFDVKKVEVLLKEVYDNLIYAEENDISFFKEDLNFMQYIYLLLIKHFSHLGKDISDKLDEQIPQFHAIVSTGLFELFFSDLFDPNEVLTVVDKVKSFVQVIDQIAQLDEQTREKILASVESPTIKKKLESNSVANG